MGPKPPNKGGEDDDSRESPTGESRQSLAGRDQSRLELTVQIEGSSRPVGDVGPEALALPQSASEVIRRLILTGTRESLQEAFRIHPATAVDVIVEVAESNDPQCVAIAPVLESTLVSLLKEHTQAVKDRAPAGSPRHQPEAFVPFQLAHAVARITRDPRARSEALDMVLSEGAALGYKGHQEVLYVLESFEPFEVMPKLIRFMRRVCGEEAAVRRVFFNGINSLIDHWSRSDNRSADVEHYREIAFSLFATLFVDLLTAEHLKEEVKKHVIVCVEARAKALGWGLTLIVAKLSEACGVSPWRLYASIVLYSDLSENRVSAARHLGEHGPTSALRPLPADVKAVRTALFLAEESTDPELRKEAKAALARNIERGKEQAANQIRISVCTMVSVSSAALSSECFIDSVAHIILPISPHLTLLPGVRETFRVCMDVPQEFSRGSTAAPSPDLDLSSLQITTNGAGDGFPHRAARPEATAIAVHADPLDLATMSFTTTDRAVQHTRMLVSGPSARITPAMAERERFREGYRALGALVESGQINAAVLNGPMAAFNKAYRELEGAESQRVIGVSKAAKILGLTKSRVQQLAREGLGQKVAGRFLFTREELERGEQRPRSRSGRPPTADQLDLASMFFTTADPAVQHTRMLLVSGLGENIGLARAEQERFRDRYRALGTLMESGEINTAALKGLMAALNEAYRELLDGEGGASAQGKFPPPRNLERDPGWADGSFEREAFPTTGTGTERVLGVSEAAGILGLTRSRVQQLARDGLIGQRVAGRFLFTREELEREKQRPRSKGGRPPTRRHEDSGRPETRPF